MRRETQNVLLVLVGGALLKISLTSTYLLYVKPSHRPWLIAGGAVILLLAAVSITRDILAARHPHAAAVTAEHGDEHEHGDHQHPARSAWLLVLPVLAIFLIAPPALGSDSVKRADNGAAVTRTSGTESGASAIYPDLPPGDVLPITMADFASRAAFDRSRALESRTVELTGFTVDDAGGTYLARLSIACCAADAFPVRVLLDGVTGIANDTWLRVTGTLVPGTATKENDYIPTLRVRTTTPVPQPENPYE
ncbi:TIGR03943 family putative permease subunit [Actinokineospora bangkokensis]|uniref:TIGR03943 family protein n=1 Tax=Actinokineospora bangkokensis TaxID=1193682 RepID=A0A1Q9LTP6_9PSEU|nr:TIGR03943 family protein [Actinokineospora bangkokensis]OLR95412.1 TIGR03943 family protein [Actinokineospora bangkokensis]